MVLCDFKKPESTGQRRLSRLLRTFATIYIAEHKHIGEKSLVPAWEATSGSEVYGILVGSKKTIPQRQVGEIVSVDIELVMNGVQLRSLDEETQPPRCLEVGVVKVLARCREEVVPECPVEGNS